MKYGDEPVEIPQALVDAYAVFKGKGELGDREEITRLVRPFAARHGFIPADVFHYMDLDRTHLTDGWSGSKPR